MQTPLVSIVVPLYNRANLVGETIQSVLDQTYPHWELIVVDDGSTDGSDAIVNAYAAQDKRIQLHYRNRHPNGAPTCRNIGVEKSIGDYLIFLDSDDLLAPFCLEYRLEKFADNPDFDFLVFPIAIFNSAPDKAERFWNTLNKPAMDDLDRCLSTDTPWQTTGPIWKKQALLKLGPWLEGIKCRQDLEFHVRALTFGLTYKKFPELYDCFYRKSESGEQISKAEGRSREYILSINKVFLSIYQSLLIHQKLTSYRSQMLTSYFIENALNNYFFQINVPLKDFNSTIGSFKLLGFTNKIRILLYFSFLYNLQSLLGRKFSMFVYGRLRFVLLPGFYRSDRYQRQIKISDKDKENYHSRLNKASIA